MAVESRIVSRCVAAVISQGWNGVALLEKMLDDSIQEKWQ